ncbi:MAG: hypothetical protein ACRD1N_09475 [Terriglobia bacterium]
MPRVKAEPISLHAVEVLSKEVMAEGVKDYQSALKKLLRAKPGTERHRSVLCDLSVAASILVSKSKIALEAIDEYLESLPDDDGD